VKETIKLPLFYFLLYSAFASWMAFFNVHLSKLGFSGIQIGALNAVFISTSAVVVPFWGMIADHRGSNRTLLLLTALTAVFVYSMSYTTAYFGFLILIFLISLFQQPMGAVVDGMVLGLVRTRPELSYGKFRLFGSAGYGITAIAVGYFAMKNTAIIFSIAAILFSIIFLINLLTLPPKPLTGRNLVNFSSLKVFMENKVVLSFFFLMLFYGISISPLFQFINLYYLEIGATNKLIGIAFAIQAGFEIPFFLFGVKLVKKTSPEFVILSAMLVSIIRMILYGFISTPEIAIFIGVLHGFTISFFLVGAVQYVQSHTPPELSTTGQSMIWAFHFGAGLTFGYLIVGYLKDLVGMQETMHIQAAFGTLILFATMLFFRKSFQQNKLLKSIS
jgi:MFS transporter, PPP family, 3-phenylpropionic acid transporter